MPEITQDLGQIVARTNRRALRPVSARIGVWLGACVGVSFLLALAAGIGTQARTPRFVITGVNTAGNTSTQHLANEPGQLAPQFAIADFDGDLRPDLASIQAGRSTSGNSTYSIHLQLSAIGRQSISVVAPIGGLTIEARDVNGDHAIDLVLATAWTERPIAIFLNDGHGGFSQAAPNAFPLAFSRSETEIGYHQKQVADAVGLVPPQSHAGIQLQSKDRRHAGTHAQALQSLRAGFALDPLVGSQAGRAPPAED